MPFSKNREEAWKDWGKPQTIMQIWPQKKEERKKGRKGGREGAWLLGNMLRLKCSSQKSLVRPLRSAEAKVAYQRNPTSPRKESDVVWSCCTQSFIGSSWWKVWLWSKGSDDISEYSCRGSSQLDSLQREIQEAWSPGYHIVLSLLKIVHLFSDNGSSWTRSIGGCED